MNMICPNSWHLKHKSMIRQYMIQINWTIQYTTSSCSYHYIIHIFHTLSSSSSSIHHPITPYTIISNISIYCRHNTIIPQFQYLSPSRHHPLSFIISLHHSHQYLHIQGIIYNILSSSHLKSSFDTNINTPSRIQYKLECPNYN